MLAALVPVNVKLCELQTLYTDRTAVSIPVFEASACKVLRAQPLTSLISLSRNVN